MKEMYLKDKITFLEKYKSKALSIDYQKKKCLFNQQNNLLDDQAFLENTKAC